MTLPHFNGLTPAEQERLVMLDEEAKEVGIEVSKTLRHGPYSYNPDAPEKGTNINKMQNEVTDFFAVLHMMIEAGDPIRLPTAIEIDAAIQKKLKYAHHQSSVSNAFCPTDQYHAYFLTGKAAPRGAENPYVGVVQCELNPHKIAAWREGNALSATCVGDPK